MGASTFINCVRKNEEIKTAAQAFLQESQRSRHESGHSYSGEIGMKHDLLRARHVPCATMKEGRDLACRLLEDSDEYGDKYGPAFYVEVIGEEVGWVFFGWAPS